jgi:hypothetical protein
VIMKTDISGSTSRFQGLLAADLQTLLIERAGPGNLHRMISGISA